MAAAMATDDGNSPRLTFLPAAPQHGLAATVAVIQDGTLAGIDGAPRWLAADLGRIAAERGHAHALIAAYRRGGTALTELLAGSFVFAVLDPERQIGMFGVDRMGIRSLAYGRADDGAVVFASHVAGVLALPGVARSIEAQGIYNYCYFHMVPSPGTLYRGIAKLEPGHVLIREGKLVTVHRYWNCHFNPTRASLGDLASELHERLRIAVERSAPGDSTGSFLSGGLDSSTVTGCLARRTAGRKVKSFSIGFSQQGYDEMSYARISANHFGTEAHEYYVTADDIVEAIPKIARAYDEPFGNSSAVPTLFCARLAKAAGIDHLLAGDGGDEIFAGNERYAKQKVFERYYALPRWLRAGVLEPLIIGTRLGGLTRLTRKGRSYIEQALVPMPLRLQSYNFLERHGYQRIFVPAFLAASDRAEPGRLMTNSYGEAPTSDIVNRMLFLDWKFTLADNDLRKVNRMCELAGIAVDYPMLDDDLVELSTRVPRELKLKGAELRYFYKQAMRGFLPQAVLEKQKHGFGLPFGEWLKESTRLQDLVYGSLSALKIRGVIEPAFIDELIDEHRAGHAGYFGTFVWVLMMLEQWLEQHEPRYRF